MKGKFTKLMAAFALLVFMAPSMVIWGQAPVNTTLWEETWTDGAAGTTPSDYNFSGTTVYGEATLTYAQSSTATKLYAEGLAGGTTPELLLSKNNQTWTISNIPTGQATGMSLTFLSNKTTFEVTSATSGITITGSQKSWTINATIGVTSFDLTIKNTGSQNARLDDILLKVTIAGTDASTVATPSISPESGNFLESQEVSITCPTEGATIYYTTNGNDPTTSSNVYSAPFTINETTTVKAIAVKSGMNNSAVASATFTKVIPMTVAEARAAIDAGTGTQDVYVTGIVSGIVEAWSTQYSNISFNMSDDGLTSSNQLEAFRCVSTDNANASEVVVGDVVIVHGDMTLYNNTVYEFTSGCQLVSLTHSSTFVATPTFSPAGGTYTEEQNVTISCETANVDIFYTTDGTDPNDESIPYSGAITVAETTTIKAIAYDGDTPSAIATATYTINLPLPNQTFSQIDGHNPVEGQTYLIVDLASGRALTSANGSSSSPTAVEVTIIDGQITTNDAALQWTFEATDDGYIIHPLGSSTTWLCYTTTNNTGVRVGDNEANVWTLDITDGSNSNYHGFKHNGTSRYLGVYQNTDWRAYTTIHANIQATQIALFVLGDAPAPAPSFTIENNNEIAYNATSGSFNFTVNNPVEGGQSSVSEDVDWISNAAISGNSVTFTTTVNEAATSREGVITLTYTYNRETVTKDVTVTQAAAPMVYTTIPALFEAATSTEAGVLVSFNNWLVSGVSTNGKNVFVTDNNGNGFVIFDNEGDLDQTYSVGDILSGTAISCTLKKYNGFAELLNVDASELTITAGGTISTSNIAMADLAGVNTGALVHYENLICSVTNNKYYLSDGTTTLQVYNALFAFEALENGETYNITGLYQQYNNTKEILPRSEADIVKVEVQHEQYNLTVSNLVNVNTYVFDASDQSEMLLEGEGTTQIYDGTQVLISVDVEEGYALQSLMVDGVNVTSQIDETDAYTFTMPTHNVTVTATAVEQIVPTGGEYVRISSLDQLTDGSIVVIASRYNTEITNYYAMKNTISNGKAQGEAFVSTTSNGNEILPAAIADDENDYYWVVNVTEDGYTFTNANGDMISCNSSSNFNMNGDNTAWSIERNTSGEALVPSYEGFVITNAVADNRCIAFRGDTEVFGPYSTQNINGDIYNFFLDFFVQTAASETITQTLELSEGWNWVSTYIDMNAVDGMAMLQEGLGDHATQIVTYDDSAEYYDGVWYWGSGEENKQLTNSEMIMVEVAEDCTVTLEGPVVGEVEITINPEWNWIGYPIDTELDFTEAMSDFDAEDEDSFNGFGATNDYFEGWYNTFNTLVPGQGYMYYSNGDEPKTLVYHRVGTKAGRIAKFVVQRKDVKLAVSTSDDVNGWAKEFKKIAKQEQQQTNKQINK